MFLIPLGLAESTTRAISFLTRSIAPVEKSLEWLVATTQVRHVHRQVCADTDETSFGILLAALNHRLRLYGGTHRSYAVLTFIIAILRAIPALAISWFGKSSLSTFTLVDLVDLSLLGGLLYQVLLYPRVNQQEEEKQY